ncbi:hypothetical protein PINS_up017444 [Pythium insidiosum]|nr:hypothetical protein PINS_up017444 [Pythium insidiosum]
MCATRNDGMMAAAAPHLRWPNGWSSSHRPVQVMDSARQSSSLRASADASPVSSPSAVALSSCSLGGGQRSESHQRVFVSQPNATRTTMAETTTASSSTSAPAPAAATVAAAAPAPTHGRPILGVIGGSSLFHAKEFSASLRETVIETEYGGVVAHVGQWKDWDLQIVFVQRHHADPDGQYKQPRQINFKAIATALKVAQCSAVIGIYSVGSMNALIQVGRVIVPEDYFNPFDIMHMSRHYDAHVVPDMNVELRGRILASLQQGSFDPYDGGVYIQTSGPRFETKAEVRFFKQFGELIGMTGANEAELLNELRVPFAMFGIVDNMANGIGEKLTLEEFKISQKRNCDRMEEAVCHVLTDLASQQFLSQFADAA